MKRYVCWCQWSMPETCVRAIAAHQQEHAIERERIEREEGERATYLLVIGDEAEHGE